ncbi:MAG: transcription antiterminator [Selenomonadaceae bacterium]|nr:transcription antiterminator [Selenomonadaceae bacterium]
MASESDKRCKKIIEILLDHPEGMKGDDIAKRLQVSSRTIRSDVKRLQELLEVHGIKISAITNRGYKLERQDVHDVLMNVLPEISSQEVLSDKNKRLLYLVGYFLEALLENKSVTQGELADEMYVALSSLKVYLNELREFLSGYFLQIVTYRNEGLRLRGDENDIRTCIVDYQREVRNPNVHGLIFAEVSSQEINFLIEEVMKQCSLQLTDVARESLCLQMALAIRRSAEGHLTICSSSVAQELEKSFEYRIAKEMVNTLYKATGKDIPYNEVFYLSKCLLTGKKLSVTPESIKENAFRNENADAIGDRLSELVDEILYTIERNYGLDFGNDEYLKEGLLLHLRIAIAQVNFRMGMRNDLLSSIKNEYPLAFQLGVLAARVVRERIKIVFQENEIGYIALHFGAAMSRNHIKESDVSKKIIIVGLIGFGMSMMLKTKIKEYFRNRINILAVLPIYKLNEDWLNQADYVFSTVPLKNFSEEKVIRINSVLGKTDLEQIEKKIFSKMPLTVENLRDIFEARNFFFDMDFASRDECLAFLTDKAVERGFMSKAAKASVFEREEMSSTAIGDFAAIPHPVDTVDNVSKIFVLTLKKAITWGDMSVQAVFLLNIENGKSQLWEEIFFKLYDYIKKFNGVTLLLKNKSYEKFFSDFIAHL